MILEFEGRWRGPKSLGAATLGTAWAAIGTARVGGARWYGAFLDVTVHDSVDMRFRLRGAYEAGGSAYYMPIATISQSEVTIEDEYAEFNVDANQKQMVVWELAGICPYCTLEASVGTAGGTAATLDTSHIVTGI